MKYIFLIKRAEINGAEQDPSIGLLYLIDHLADELIEAGKAIEVASGQVGPEAEVE